MRRIMPRPAVQRERKTHFLQHVSVVVYHRLVNAKSDWDAAGKEANKIRDPALEPEVRRAIMAKATPTLGQKRYIVLSHPDAMPDRELRSDQAEAVDMGHR